MTDPQAARIADLEAKLAKAERNATHYRTEHEKVCTLLQGQQEIKTELVAELNTQSALIDEAVKVLRKAEITQTGSSNHGCTVHLKFEGRADDSKDADTCTKLLRRLARSTLTKLQAARKANG